MMNPYDVFNALMRKQWLLPSAFAIGLIVRLLKSDTALKLPFSKKPLALPPAIRSWSALILGAAAGIIDKAVETGNTTWTLALLQGVGAGVFAMTCHELVIESLRGGKEIPIPGLTLPGVPPGPGKPVSIPAPADLTAIPAPANLTPIPVLPMTATPDSLLSEVLKGMTDEQRAAFTASAPQGPYTEIPVTVTSGEPPTADATVPELPSFTTGDSIPPPRMK